ncbi:MAG TPA: head GIN domain-containing protein [Chitinophagaceae bacterium]|nr:head GIN domain-containing protein [Chitinophagaceae bacterium]
MRKLFLVSMVIVFFTSLATAQKKVYDENAEVRLTGKDFHGIKVSGGIDLYLSQGDETNVVVSARETKFRDRIKTEIEDGVLKIWYDSDYDFKIFSVENNRKLKAYVSCKMLDKLIASGASDVIIEGSLKANKIEITLSGASDLKGAINATALAIKQSGSSDAVLSGSADDLVIRTSGASDFKGYDFSVQTCEAHASGASDIQITVNKELKAHASGTSDIHYKGSASITDLNTSGSSNVKRRKD